MDTVIIGHVVNKRIVIDNKGVVAPEGKESTLQGYRGRVKNNLA
jgi:hypothetical protein